jgi:hypothetical protein
MYMKKFLFFLLATGLFVGKISAQDTIKTLIHLSKIRNVGIYFAPEFQYGQSNGAFTAFSGGSAMLQFNHRFAVGLTGASTSSESFSPKGVAPLLLQSDFGGIKMEYTVRPASAIHVTFPLVIGSGEARADSVRTTIETNSENENHQNGGRESGLSSAYFVIQPGVQIEANVLRFAKVFAGANYRIASKTGATSTLPTDALSGLGINAGIKIGIFDIRKPHFHGRHHEKRG